MKAGNKQSSCIAWREGGKGWDGKAGGFKPAFVYIATGMKRVRTWEKMIEKPCIALETGGIWPDGKKRTASRLGKSARARTCRGRERARRQSEKNLFELSGKNLDGKVREMNEWAAIISSVSRWFRSFVSLVGKFPSFPKHASRVRARRERKRTRADAQKEKYRGVSATRLNKSCLARTNEKQSADRTAEAGRPPSKLRTAENTRPRRNAGEVGIFSLPRPVRRRAAEENKGMAREPKTNASN